MEQLHNDSDILVEDQTKGQRNFKVVLYNDEDHTYEYVVEMITKCCNLSKSQAFKCTVEVDLTGRSIVNYGSKVECQKVRDKVNAYGADHRMLRSVGSMNSEVEPC
ncbi:MAG: ATP-dependent Clp protease adaptor ClpS [Fibrobacterales bacterium]